MSSRPSPFDAAAAMAKQNPSRSKSPPQVFRNKSGNLSFRVRDQRRIPSEPIASAGKPAFGCHVAPSIIQAMTLPTIPMIISSASTDFALSPIARPSLPRN